MGGSDSLGGVHVERSTFVTVPWRRMSSPLEDGQAVQGVEFHENAQERTAEVEIRVAVMCSYLAAARGLDHEDSAERSPVLVSMIQRLERGGVVGLWGQGNAWSASRTPLS